MSKTVTIPLASPIEEHGRFHPAIILREPRWEDIMGVGAPYTIHRDAEDKPFLIYDEVAIKHYAEACIVNPPVIFLEKGIGIAETLKVREAIVNFFLDAAVGDGGSKT